MSKIIIAIPRGRIIKECKKFLSKTSFAPDPKLYDNDSRKLKFKSKDKNVDYIKVRAFDVCTFVAFGAAQVGVAAEKKLLRKENPDTWSNIRVATKYPNLTKKFLPLRVFKLK